MTKKVRRTWKRTRTFHSRKTNRFLKRKSFAIIFKTAAFAGFIASAAYFLFFSEFFLIDKITIEGNAKTNLLVIENLAKKKMNEPFFEIIPGNNFFLVRNKEIEKLLLDEILEIKSVEIKKDFPDSIKIKVTEREPAVIWCRLENCYYLDYENIAFLLADHKIVKDKKKKTIKIIEQPEIEEEKEENNFNAKKLDILTDNKNADKNSSTATGNHKNRKSNPLPVVSEANVDELKNVLHPIKLGDKVSDKDFISFAIDIDKKIEYNTSLKIKYYKTKGTKTRELIAYTDNNVRIYFNAAGKAEAQVRNLSDFLSKGIDKKQIRSLEYIYLKAESKIFYK